MQTALFPKMKSEIRPTNKNIPQIALSFFDLDMFFENSPRSKIDLLYFAIELKEGKWQLKKF